MTSHLRKDIQGLRAIAVTVVVAYHAAIPLITGGFIGVDIFYVISGFLITALLLREIDRSDTISLSRFWARRARRLLPASSLVIVVTLLASAAIVPRLERETVAVDGLFATFFAANWRFAQQQTDYLAADRVESPFLHYWSLGVEEQFYIVWPLLILAVLVVARRSGATSRMTRRALAGVFALVFVVSLAYCVMLTQSNQPYAFFGTPARAWQLAAGALLAVVITRAARLPVAVLRAFGVTGLGLLILAIVTLKDGGTLAGVTYPSFLALLPTAAGVLLLAAGARDSAGLLNRALSTAPMQYIGNLSYSWYLWHWPVLVLGTMYFDSERWYLRGGLVMLSLLCAAASYHLVENPIRYARSISLRPLRSYAVGAMSLVLALGSTAVLSAAATADSDRISSADIPGAHAERYQVDPDRLVPSFEEAVEERGMLLEAGCQVGWRAVEVPDADDCTFGDADGERLAVSIGDSIGTALAPGIIRAAEESGWRLVAWGKSQCNFAGLTLYLSSQQREYEECPRFRDRLLAEVRALDPDVLFISMAESSVGRIVADGEQLTGEAARREAAAALQETVEEISDWGVHVALVEPPVRTLPSPTVCLAEELDVMDCTFERRRGGPPVAARVAEAVPGVSYVTITDEVCDDEIGLCFPVVNNMLVYQDQVHYTEIYAESIWAVFARPLRRFA